MAFWYWAIPYRAAYCVTMGMLSPECRRGQKRGPTDGKAAPRIRFYGAVIRGAALPSVGSPPSPLRVGSPLRNTRCRLVALGEGRVPVRTSRVGQDLSQTAY